MAKGRMIYVPPLIIEERDNIMRQEGLTIKSEGLKKMVTYSRIGRESLLKKGELPFIPIGFSKKRLKI
jgi:hypothetical protein